MEWGFDGAPVAWYAVDPSGEGFLGAAPTSDDLFLKYARFDPLRGEPPVPEALRAEPGSSLRIVQFFAPLTGAARSDLEAAGVRFLKFLPSNAWIVRDESGGARGSGPRAGLAALAGRGDVRWVGPFHAAYKADRALLERAGGRVTVNIQVFRTGMDQKRIVAAAVEALGGKVESLPAGGYLLRATLDAASLRSVLRMDEVMRADEWGPGGADMDLARQISGANYVEATLGYIGQGVRGEVLDSNIRATHVDFQNPGVLLHGPTPAGPTDHGTGCYGIVFGKGVGNPQARGCLPGAEQGIFGDREEITDRYAFTMQSVDAQGPYRAVFQASAWGGDLTTQYTTQSMEMDHIIFDSDLAIFQSMSNAGTQQARPQAWAKNVIACGGIIHNNTLARSDDGWFGGASIGPAADGRVKPDLAHFYDDVLSPWDGSDTDYYQFFGTSSATMITAGHAGLLMQMWHEGVFAGHGAKATVFESRPRAATARAMLINSAYRYPFASPADDLSRAKQGWGMVDLQALHERRLQTFIVDESVALTAGATARYRFAVGAGGGPLRATLVYRDPPGNTVSSVARINDLSLRVTAPGGAPVYWGNNGLLNGNWSVAGGSANTIDTVENVFIEAPAEGTWTVDVLATEVNEDGHPGTPAIDAVFALVVSGAVRVPCPGDWNGDGNVTPADIAAFVSTWSQSLAAGTLAGDFDGNGVVSPADIAAFVSAWSATVAAGGC